MLNILSLPLFFPRDIREVPSLLWEPNDRASALSQWYMALEKKQTWEHFSYYPTEADWAKANAASLLRGMYWAFQLHPWHLLIICTKFPLLDHLFYSTYHTKLKEKSQSMAGISFIEVEIKIEPN